MTKRLVILLLLFGCGRIASGVLFKSTADSSYNTTAPTGSLTNSGWQYQGQWGSFLGTPIAPTFFITAKHVGGTNGQEFVLNGFSYHAMTNYPDPNSDLNVWKVAETFPAYAPLYTNTAETSKHCTVFGRGTQRGSTVIVDGETNGWMWGAADGVQRWGENDVASIEDGGPGIGSLLRATFDRNANSNECHLSVGDSGGGMFIQDNGVWKLAGIHHAIDSFFSYTGSETDEFNAALLDMGGLYIGGSTNWMLVTNQVVDIPSAFYSTRISTNITWINSVIDFDVGPDLRILSLAVVSNDVRLSFNTTLNRVYRIEYRDDLITGAWMTLTNNLPGTGNIMSVFDTGAAVLPRRFYRLGLMP